MTQNVPVATASAAKTWGKRALLLFGICLVLGLAVQLVPAIRQWTLPSYAKPAFIEAHYAPQIEELRRLAESGQRPDDNQKQLFDSDDILAARIMDYGEGGRSGLSLKDTKRAEPGRAWFPASPTTKNAVINIWGGVSVQYERQVQTRDQKLRGYQLFVDLNALKERASKTGGI